MMLNNGFDDLRFFQPSVELTEHLVSAIQTAHLADLERVKNDEQQVEQDENVPEDFGSEVSGLDLNYSNSELEPEPEIVFQRRHIGVELYGLLAFEAQSPQATAGHAISIYDSVTSGMSVSLGLPKQHILLSNLASEFGGWLKGQGEFLAGWGRVIFSASDHMYLEAFPFVEADRSEEELADVVKV